MARDLTKERQKACVPIAMAILRTIAAEEDLFMGEREQAELDVFFKDFFAKKIEPIIRNADIKIADMAYIFQILRQPIDNVNTVMVDGVNDAFDTVVAHKLGVEDVNDVKISDIVRAQTEAMAQVIPNGGVDSKDKAV